MAQSFQVNLAFTADTTQAKAQIQSLQQQLNNLGNNITKDPFTKFESGAAKALADTQKLSAALKAATNQETGRLDLSLFSQSLSQAGLSLKGLQTSMSALGDKGNSAFLSLAKSIVQAETPMKQTNGLLKEMGKTLLNTVKWQISSSAIHAFMGGISSALSYAKSLDSALTDIRIVTSESTDQMAKFAEQANKAAQALSTTTTTYAKAALIYYQQGLSDAEVQERTEATIKMAQATGDSATSVSSYMTAIWNNFDDGSQSLEHYADVITALGAATASSSSEIADGLQKFASVADTVGLSYDYATSAMATIVAQTRQSADTVGTALKTLLARIQDLELGDEGTVSIGTYAQALEKVGIEVLQADGTMKDMDSILDDMGEKWQTMTKAQQTALAQNVAGEVNLVLA